MLTQLLSKRKKTLLCGPRAVSFMSCCTYFELFVETKPAGCFRRDSTNFRCQNEGHVYVTMLIRPLTIRARLTPNTLFLFPPSDDDLCWTKFHREKRVSCLVGWGTQLEKNVEVGGGFVIRSIRCCLLTSAEHLD